MRRRRWGLGLVGALVAAASAGACRQTLGLDGYSNARDASAADLDASACGLSYATAACAACAARQCCELSNACAQDLQCSNCVGACGGDAGCQGACIAQSFVASQSGADLAACL